MTIRPTDMKNQKHTFGIRFKGALTYVRHKKNVPIALAILLFCFGCKKYVQVPPPTTQLVTASVFNNNATATSAQTNIYTLMFSNNESYTMAVDLGYYSDELKAYTSSSGPATQLYTNSLSPIQLYPAWQNAYKYIYDANAVINGLQTTVGCSPAVKQQLIGEAYFIRAFWHFYATNLYGDAPLVLTTDYNINGKIGRTSRIQVLQQVIADLKNAQNLLNSNYVDASDTLTTTDRARPNKAVATALLARAYLYLGDYAKDASQYVNAEAQASAVIANSAYSLSSLTGTNSVFMKNSSEAIWQLRTPLSGSGTAAYDTNDGVDFILISAPSSTSGFNNSTISTQLMNSFETGDLRKTNWISSYSTTTTPNVTYNFPYKYKNRTYLNQEYVMVLRLGEQYLVRAEARAQQGNINGALADLNMIRSRAGLQPYAGATDKVSLLTAILHERQVELFCEWGHRWFDLCRTGNAPAVMGVVTPLKGGVWNSDNHQLLFPIPQVDLNADVNLTQNPGY